MPITYRRPGVYLEESLLVNSADTASTFTVACFIGVAEKGPINEPTRVDSWSDYVTLFGGFSPIQPPGTGPVPPKALSYLPYAVYSFFQSGGRTAYIIRAVPTAPVDQGTAATIVVNGTDAGETPLGAFTIRALSAGVWGNKLKYKLDDAVDRGHAPTPTASSPCRSSWSTPTAWTRSWRPTPTSRSRVRSPAPVGSTSAVNDPVVRLAVRPHRRPATSTRALPVVETNGASLAGGVDPKIPDAPALVVGGLSRCPRSRVRCMVNIVGYHSDISKINSATEAATSYVGGHGPGSHLERPLRHHGDQRLGSASAARTSRRLPTSPRSPPRSEPTPTSYEASLRAVDPGAQPAGDRRRWSPSHRVER